jgi:hypothetical protein
MKNAMNLLNMKRLYAPVAFIAIILGGCAAIQPIPEVAHPQSSALAIDVNTPGQIYFARIEGEDGLLQQKIIRSNYRKNNRAYLLNAQPGTYVAVGTFVPGPGVPAGPPPGFSVSVTTLRSGYTTYFSKELVELTKVTVQEGEFAFMGSYVVDRSWGLDGADEVQTHYKNVIAPGSPSGIFLMSLIRDYHYLGTMLERKSDEQTRNDFFRNAKDDLADSGWGARIK